MEPLPPKRIPPFQVEQRGPWWFVVDQLGINVAKDPCGACFGFSTEDRARDFREQISVVRAHRLLPITRIA